VTPDGPIDWRYYEICVLSELRGRLPCGDIWVAGSRRYRSFEERLISQETLRELEASGDWPTAVDADFEDLEHFSRGRNRMGDSEAGTSCD